MRKPIKVFFKINLIQLRKENFANFPVLIRDIEKKKLRARSAVFYRCHDWLRWRSDVDRLIAFYFVSHAFMLAIKFFTWKNRRTIFNYHADESKSHFRGLFAKNESLCVEPRGAKNFFSMITIERDLKVLLTRKSRSIKKSVPQSTLKNLIIFIFFVVGSLSPNLILIHDKNLIQLSIIWKEFT